MAVNYVPDCRNKYDVIGQFSHLLLISLSDKETSVTPLTMQARLLTPTLARRLTRLTTPPITPESFSDNFVVEFLPLGSLSVRALDRTCLFLLLAYLRVLIWAPYCLTFS